MVEVVFFEGRKIYHVLSLKLPPPLESVCLDCFGEQLTHSVYVFVVYVCIVVDVQTTRGLYSSSYYSYLLEHTAYYAQPAGKVK